jgi:hypothetical protein
MIGIIQSVNFRRSAGQPSKPGCPMMKSLSKKECNKLKELTKAIAETSLRKSEKSENSQSG